jgi:hypothetical protein
VAAAVEGIKVLLETLAVQAAVVDLIVQLVAQETLVGTLQ